jgi:hypothetical protein
MSGLGCYSEFEEKMRQAAARRRRETAERRKTESWERLKRQWAQAHQAESAEVVPCPRCC